MVTIATLQRERDLIMVQTVDLYDRWSQDNRRWPETVKETESSILRIGLATDDQIGYFETHGTAALNAFWKAHESKTMQQEMFSGLSVAEMCVVLRVLASHINTEVEW